MNVRTASSLARNVSRTPVVRIPRNHFSSASAMAQQPTARVTSFDHIVLTVASIPKTEAWYEKHLGMKASSFTSSSDPPGVERHALSFGQQKINLHQAGKEFEPKAQNVKSGSGDLCFVCETSVDEVLEGFKKEGIEVLEGGKVVERLGAQGQLRSVYVRDPDGNLIDLSVALAKSFLATNPEPGSEVPGDAQKPSSKKKKKQKQKKKVTWAEEAQVITVTTPLAESQSSDEDGDAKTATDASEESSDKSKRSILKNSKQRLTVVAPTEPSSLQLAFICDYKHCQAPVSDLSTSTVCCPSCGPWDRTRYCSAEHLVADASSHFQICGLDPLGDIGVPKRLLSTPSYNQDVHGFCTSARLRQHAYFTFENTHCDYAIFMDNHKGSKHGASTVLKLKWPENGAPDTSESIRGLIEIAFNDHSQIDVLSLLYDRILRKLDALTTEELDFTRSEYVTQLKLQLWREFGFRGGY